jgi:hypothetical protein
MPYPYKPLPLWSGAPPRAEAGSAPLPSRESGPDASPAAPRPAESSARPSRAARCNERGCVFPAEPDALGKCIHHQRELTEPDMLCSLQPTLLLLGQAKFGLLDYEPDDSRFVDRRRQAAEWEAFQLEEAA